MNQQDKEPAVSVHATHVHVLVHASPALVPVQVEVFIKNELS